MRRRPDVTRAGQLGAFLAWLLGSGTQREAGGGSGRSFRDQHAWCWNVAPSIPVTGEVYDQVQVDGTYLSGGWCLLLAIDGSTGTVIAWQWCGGEKVASWTALLMRIPAPRVVVCDGGPGLASALGTCWPTTRVQRCLVHVQRNVRTYLTRRPRTQAGKALRALSLALTQITTRDQASAWEVKLHQWYQAYGELINAKTYLADVGVRPAWAKAGAKWWWTHDRLRKAYRLLERLTRQGVLFTYLDQAFDALDIASTTNRIEGGTNHPIKNVLRTHRGMNDQHRHRACEWWAYLHSTKPKPPATLIRPEHWQPAKPTVTSTNKPDGPASYDHALTPEEGLWTRKGWAGRSH